MEQIETSEIEAISRAFLDSIDRGMEALENGSEFAPAVEAVPGAPIEMFDILDIHTGVHLMIWRVKCRNRSKHAN